MAEFLNDRASEPPLAGMGLMGHPIPYKHRQRGYEHAKAMGLDSDKAFAVVDIMAEQLARDKPYEAMQGGMKYLDLTGTYRLMAVLLTPLESDDEA